MFRQALRLFEARGALLGKALMTAWVAVALLGISSLGVSHMAAMPEPGRQLQLVRAALALRADAGRPFRLHVIYEKCSCTERLFTHLVERGAHADIEERVVFVGEGDVKRDAAERAGFGFTVVPASELLSLFGLEAAPVLLAFDRSGTLQYAGGYFDHPSALKSLDEKIHAELAEGARPSPLPVFGCAVSPALQGRLDPLGIVYSRD